MALLRAMRTRGHPAGLERAAKALALSGEWGALWTASALAAAAVDGGRRERWLRAATVPPATVLMNFAVKVAVRRPRPDLGRRLPPLTTARSGLSFPSAHAAASFAAASTMGRIAPSARPTLFATAVAMSLTRPYLGLHYPSDVVAGAALGLGVGRWIAIHKAKARG
jgi:membrane-associated phospholipid phosphatase